MSQESVTISMDMLDAIITKTVVRTLKTIKVNTATKSEYHRMTGKSRTTINKMIKRGELKVNKQDEIILE